MLKQTKREASTKSETLDAKGGNIVDHDETLKLYSEDIIREEVGLVIQKLNVMWWSYFQHLQTAWGTNPLEHGGNLTTLLASGEKAGIFATILECLVSLHFFLNTVHGGERNGRNVVDRRVVTARKISQELTRGTFLEGRNGPQAEHRSGTRAALGRVQVARADR